MTTCISQQDLEETRSPQKRTVKELESQSDHTATSVSPGTMFRSSDTQRVTQGLAGVDKYIKNEPRGEGDLLSRPPGPVCVQSLLHPLSPPKRH